MSEHTDVLTEEYVKDKYNADLRNLPENYTNRRWFHSVESEFDYNQTKRSFLNAFGTETYDRGLEVGPGDAVWTKFVVDKVTRLDVLDQSVEMLARAKEVLSQKQNVTYIQTNFAEHVIEPAAYDVVFSIRCFEYITDKDAAIKKFYDTLTPGGKFILITKNPRYKNQSGWKNTLMHTQQIGKQEVVALLKKHGFKVDAVSPAVMRWKSKYALARFVFDTLHKINIYTKGRVYVPFLTDLCTESYMYVAHKDKMLVEMYGLSGSGKSTLAKELAEKDTSIKHVSAQYNNVEVFRFMFRHPVLSFAWLGEMLFLALRHNEWTLFRYRLSIILRTFATFGYAERIPKGVVLLDEGLFQRVLSIYEKERSAKSLERLMKLIPKVDLLILVDRGNESRYIRFDNNKDHPRAKLGEAYLASWKVMIEKNNDKLQQAVATLRVPHVWVKKEDTLDKLLYSLKTL